MITTLAFFSVGYPWFITLLSNGLCNYIITVDEDPMGVGPLAHKRRLFLSPSIYHRLRLCQLARKVSNKMISLFSLNPVW